MKLRSFIRSSSMKSISLRERLRRLKDRRNRFWVEPLFELNAKDLRDDKQWPGARNRVRTQSLNPQYKGISRDGVIYFETNSGTHGPSVKWRQKVQLLDLKEAIRLQENDTKITNRDVVLLAVMGRIKIYCNCPSFLYYGWQYINWELGTGIEPEARYPKVRNPNLVGTSCKHSLAVLQVYPFYISKITRDLVRQGVLGKPSHYKKLKLDVDEPYEPEDKTLWEYNYD